MQSTLQLLSKEIKYNIALFGNPSAPLSTDKNIYTSNWIFWPRSPRKIESYLKTKEYNLISIGHRNPQGLYYDSNKNIIINTEHGPKGGDEINFNFQNTNQTPNFGWDISSYGTPYLGKADPYKKSHEDYGFIEPFKYYVPSIGISQLIYMPNEFNSDEKKYLYVSSLRATSIYKIKISEEFDKILDEDRIYFSQKRIRDIEFDQENNVILIMFEYIPSLGVLKLNQNFLNFF